MAEVVRISPKEFQKNVFVHGLIGGVAFMLLMLVLRFTVRNVSGLVVPLDSLILCFVALYEVRHVARRNGPLGFLQAFSLVFFTGVWAFILFGGLMMLYSLADRGMLDLFMMKGSNQRDFTPVVVLVSEGIGASIIIALLGTFYSDRFADHDARP